MGIVFDRKYGRGRAALALAGAAGLLAAGCGTEEPAGGAGGTGGGAPVTETFAVKGTVSGLAGSGLKLQLNDRDDLAITADGSFAFATELEDGTPFRVSVGQQPAGPVQVCTVQNGSGTIDGGDVSNVRVACETSSFSVGVTVSSLQGEGLVLRLNDGESIEVLADGVRTFDTELLDGSPYAVTVASQPTNPLQICAVAEAEGTLDGADVTLAVTCASETFTVGGTLTGLTGTGLVLQNNGADDLTLDADGAFTFSTALPDGSPYRVEVATQPADVFQRCSVQNGEGNLAGASVDAVSVSCVNTHSIGGSVSGLDGTLVLQNNGGDDLELTADGSFTFPTRLDKGAPFAVTVLTQPDGQSCTVARGNGLAATDFDGVEITCQHLYSVGGTVTGLDADGLVLRSIGGEQLPISDNGPFTFPTPQVEGSPFAVGIHSQPTGQVCSITGGSGTLTENYTGVQVSCADQSFTIGGTVTGLESGTLVLTLNGVHDLDVTSSSFTFPNGLPDGAVYTVTVKTQPEWWLVCNVQAGGTGTVNGANVTNVQIRCLASA